jgi:hypothetical protein
VLGIALIIAKNDNKHQTPSLKRISYMILEAFPSIGQSSSQRKH